MYENKDIYVIDQPGYNTNLDLLLCSSYCYEQWSILLFVTSYLLTTLQGCNLIVDLLLMLLCGCGLQVVYFGDYLSNVPMERVQIVNIFNLCIIT